VASCEHTRILCDDDDSGLMYSFKKNCVRVARGTRYSPLSAIGVGLCVTVVVCVRQYDEGIPVNTGIKAPVSLLLTCTWLGCFLR
jgi:hypothetical protein